LTNLTLDFLDKHWASEIDFVVWTGDNVRHDNDRKIPRTLDEIFGLNSMLATAMENIFLKKGIPVVPSLGNNDVWPHNILPAG
jgi:endopolyphosphatase